MVYFKEKILLFSRSILKRFRVSIFLGEYKFTEQSKHYQLLSVSLAVLILVMELSQE